MQGFKTNKQIIVRHNITRDDASNEVPRDLVRRRESLFSNEKATVQYVIITSITVSYLW